MHQLVLKQKLQHKLSPQQLQLFQLLKNSTAEIDKTIQKCLEENPVLEEINNNTHPQHIATKIKNDYAWYDQPSQTSVEKPIAVAKETLHEQLLEQMSFLSLSETEIIIAKEIIGNIDEEGYLCTDLLTMKENIAFAHYIEIDLVTFENILQKIQNFEPVGVGGRDLRECLLLQLRNKSSLIAKTAYKILLHCFEPLTYKHYDKIKKKLHIQEDVLLEKAIRCIEKLNPKPGLSQNQEASAVRLYPDFLLKKNQDQLEVYLSEKNYPKLGIKKYYIDLLTTYHNTTKKNKNTKEALAFLKEQYTHAQNLIQSIQQRQHTLLAVMHAIVDKQRDFFQEEKVVHLKPLRLKDIAEVLQMDISTISRAIHNKSIQTEQCTYLLKFFFVEKSTDIHGNVISNKQVQAALQVMIDQEDKKKPLSDEKIYELLKAKGYLVARRTIAKYREKLKIPVARLRKVLSSHKSLTH